MTEHYLVTGGCGFIGSHLVEALLRSGAQVSVLDDLSTGRRENLPAGVDLVVDDIRNGTAVAHAMQHCTGVFHLAAIASVPKCTQSWHDSHQVNLSASVGIFEMAAERDLPVVYASSSAIYGDVQKTPIGEDDTKQPISAYGVDKYAMELHAGAGARTRNLRTFGLRFFNIYGPRQDPHSPYSGVIAVFMRNAMEGRPIVIHGDGGQIRDFVFVTDAVRSLRGAMARLVRYPHATSLVANVCTGRPTSIKALAHIVADLIDPSLEVAHASSRLGDIVKSIGDPARHMSLLGFRPETSLTDGLRTMIEQQSAQSAPVPGALQTRELSGT